MITSHPIVIKSPNAKTGCSVGNYRSSSGDGCGGGRPHSDLHVSPFYLFTAASSAHCPNEEDENLMKIICLCNITVSYCQLRGKHPQRWVDGRKADLHLPGSTLGPSYRSERRRVLVQSVQIKPIREAKDVVRMPAVTLSTAGVWLWVGLGGGPIPIHINNFLKRNHIYKCILFLRSVA